VADVLTIEDPEAIAAATHPVRAALLAAMREPTTAAAAARATGQSRQNAAYHVRELAKAGGKVGVVGYCFGGTTAIELAYSGADLDGVVSFHGGLDSPHPEDGQSIRCKVLALHGADDPHVSAKDLAAFEDEMRQAKVDWQLIQYGGAVHSFTDWNAGSDPQRGSAYHERADQRSWEAMKTFFNEILK